ncbi:hypothetical protein Mapa_001033 [Marchantia paleacea]|nr:hypothetical protein Mapa_001033 [Marchantia paleacea]
MVCPFRQTQDSPACNGLISRAEAKSSLKAIVHPLPQSSISHTIACSTVCQEAAVGQE